MRSGVRVLLMIRTVWRSDHQDSCELVPAVLSPPPYQPYQDNRPARILRISPRLPPYQPIHHLSRSKCGDLPPHSPGSFLPFSFLHICMILALHHALRSLVPQWISSHLHVSSNVSAVLVSCAEQPLDFPFSSAFLIGGTGCLYYRSSKSNPSPSHHPSKRLFGI